jgi:hypothetical protein
VHAVRCSESRSADSRPVKHKGCILIKQVGKTRIGPVHKATCHCGAIEIEILLPDGLVDPRRCNCSICRRKGTIVASAPLAALRIVKGKEKLSLYQFDTKEAEHYFCSVCGIYTHHKRRSNPNQYGINLGCLEGVEPNLVEGIKTYDGANNHPSE